jgi:hypothetical protein|tara:strand:- start:2681 stop:3220 length:540 start_codon:yes stop_codon:yes gene_type:complete
MGSRDLVTPRQRQALADVLTSFLLAELLTPSQPLWLISAWISDVEILDNTAGAFDAIAPDWPRGPIRLSAVIARIIGLGGCVFVGMRRDSHNEWFVDRLRQIERDAQGRLRWEFSDELHQKCLCGERFALRGSMNVTWNGLNANEEQMSLTTSTTEISRLRLELSDRWVWPTNLQKGAA